MQRLKTLITALSLGWAATAATSVFASQPLLAPQELQSRLADANVRVIDIRDPKSYAAGHIPGAVSAPYGQWRGPASSPGEMPALPKLTALVQSLGLTPATHAVVVSSGADATDFGASARVYWTLKVLGVKELSVLNGGVKAWADAKLEQNNEAVKIASSSFQPQLDGSLIAAAKVAGTLPDAVNLQHDKWFAPGSATFVGAEQAKQIAAASQVDPAKETVSFCNTGHWAATNWFAMSEVLGQKKVKLYPGSMAAWSQDPNGLPIANAPNRAEQLLMDAKIWTTKAFN